MLEIYIPSLPPFGTIFHFLSKPSILPLIPSLSSFFLKVFPHFCSHFPSVHFPTLSKWKINSCHPPFLPILFYTNFIQLRMEQKYDLIKIKIKKTEILIFWGKKTFSFRDFPWFFLYIFVVVVWQKQASYITIFSHCFLSRCFYWFDWYFPFRVTRTAQRGKTVILLLQHSYFFF